MERLGDHTFRIILTQGLNRQIRRMCRAVGNEVKRLKRVRVLNIELGAMKPGEQRVIRGEELEELYRIPFLIWANYDIEEKEIERTSNNYLATYLAEISGIETTGYLRYLTRLRKEIPCINALGYWGDDGNYYDLEDKTSPYYAKLKEYRFLEYNNIFAKEEQIGSFFWIKSRKE